MPRTACLCWCAPASRISTSRRRRACGRSSTEQLREGPRRVIEEPGYIGQELEIDLQQGQTLVLEKLAACYTSRDPAISECGLAARKAMARAGRFDAVMAQHVMAWKHLWRRFDVHMQPAGSGVQAECPDAAALEHVASAAGGVAQLDRPRYRRAGPRLDGEAYQGHIFWDELFIFPFLNYRMPEITRSLLMYRYRRLERGARRGQRAQGFKGPCFPGKAAATDRRKPRNST